MGLMPTAHQALEAAAQHYQTGKLHDAESVCRVTLRSEPQNPSAWELLGNILAAQGKFEDAASCCRRVVELLPQAAPAHFNLANFLLQLGKCAAAAECYQRAITLDPNLAQAHSNLGVALQQQGHLPEATACYQRAVELNPAGADACNNWANALNLLGRRNDAIELYRRALQLRPRFPDAAYNLALALQDQGDIPQAAAWYRHVLHMVPRHIGALNNLGNILRQQRQFSAAADCFRRAIDITPDLAEAHNNLGIVFQDQGDPAQAAACFQRAVDLRPAYAEAHNNLANASKDLCVLVDAVPHYQQALELNPQYGEVLNDLGLLLQTQGKSEEAAAYHQRALALNSGDAYAHWCMSLLLLLRGDLQRGWPEHEWRWQCNQWLRECTRGPRSFPQPRWDGSPLQEKTILLVAEQGLGDTLQFARYVRVLKEMGGHVILECQEPLIPILQSCGADALVPEQLVAQQHVPDQLVAEQSAPPSCDVYAPLLSLPAILNTTLETIPNRVPYLAADSALIEHWRARLSPIKGRRIGINWEGRRGAGVHRLRSIPLEMFEPLLQLPNVTLISLQKESSASSAGLACDKTRPALVTFSDLDTARGPFMDTAAIMMNLDLVITSDTSIAHLAGALGVPVWVVLPYVPDWRWLLNRSDSPWYPTMRLFRQKSPGDWTAPFAEIKTQLAGQSNRAS
jgi:tetratricopeptide (TPR) repeat protein